jgi:hypothetical protein
MRFTNLSVLAVVAISLISTDTHAASINRKFHPVVNDDPQNSHLNVQTPGADINQTVVIQEEPGPDGQVIPAGDTKVASCAVKDASGDIDLSGGDSCPSSAASAPVAERTPVTGPAIGSTASAPIAERASVAGPTIGQASSPSPRTVSQTLRVPSLASASVARAASKAAPVARRAAVAVRSPALSPAHGIENAQAAVSSRPVKQPAPVVRAHGVSYEYAGLRWLEIGLFGLAAALLVAIGLELLFRMGQARLLLRRDARRPDEEQTTQDGQIPAVVQDPLPSP